MNNITKRETTMNLEKGQRIYYGGDMANNEGTGTIMENKDTKWGTEIIIKMDDGRDIDISPCNFSEVYLGHGGTRFVTLEAYNDYRQEQFKLMGIEAPLVTEVKFTAVNLDDSTYGSQICSFIGTIYK